MVFDGIDRMKRKGREERYPRNGLTHVCHGGGGLVTQQMATETGLCALCVLELDHRRALDSLLAHAKKPCGHLRDDTVRVWLQPVRVATFTSAGERAQFLGGNSSGDHHLLGDRAVGHPTAVDRQSDLKLLSRRVAPVQRNGGANGIAVRKPFALGKKLEVEPVKTASRATDTILDVIWRAAVLGLEPGRHNQLVGPARVAQSRWGFEQRVRAVVEALVQVVGDLLD